MCPKLSKYPDSPGILHNNCNGAASDAREAVIRRRGNVRGREAGVKTVGAVGINYTAGDATADVKGNSHLQGIQSQDRTKAGQTKPQSRNRLRGDRSSPAFLPGLSGCSLDRNPFRLRHPTLEGQSRETSPSLSPSLFQIPVCQRERGRERERNGSRTTCDLLAINLRRVRQASHFRPLIAIAFSFQVPLLLHLSVSHSCL